MINAIKIEKSYGALNALKALSLHIPEGECYGLLGPNGAGKTTAIHILCSLLIPDGGTVHINQIDAFAESKAVKQMIGVVPQEISLYNELSALENLKFWGGLYGLSSSKVKERAEWALKRTGLWDRKDDLLGTYSGGMQRRVNIASAILHSPKVLFMDEPTVGIDPQSRYHIYELIEELHAQGMTLLYTTHYMEEAERLCDRIGIIDHGEIIAEGKLEELQKTHGATKTIRIQATEISEQSLQGLKNEFGDRIKITGNDLELIPEDNWPQTNELSKIITACDKLMIRIKNLDVAEVNLEQIFMNLTGKALRD